jgi:hypothetical protein
MKNNYDYEGMVAYYPLVIEAAIEFKLYAKIVLAKYKSKSDLYFCQQNQYALLILNHSSIIFIFVQKLTKFCR